MFGIMIIWEYWISEFYQCGVCLPRFVAARNIYATKRNKKLYSKYDIRNTKIGILIKR